MKQIIVKSIKNGVKRILVDDEDYPTLIKWKWYVIKHRNTFYARRDVRDPEHRQIKMHRQVLNVINPKIEVDHIDHNGLNNQKHNLRKCSGDGNKKNRGKHIATASKYLGVCLRVRKENGRAYTYWVAIITTNGQVKRKQFPYTKAGEIEAAKERDNMSKRYFGEFANLNFKN